MLLLNREVMRFVWIWGRVKEAMEENRATR